ncbi:elongation factor P [Vagococcus salmoninarum]|uniref:elongation factor P n=2 Tax=Vagococcus salmoninarum TaxID=2739 RepID=UPI003F97D758
MISVNAFEKGLTIEVAGEIYRILEVEHVKPSKGSAFVQTMLQNLRTSESQKMTFPVDEKVAKGQIIQREVQYLYGNGSSHVFMDTETYEQVELPTKQIVVELNYLLENSLCQLMLVGTETLGVILPKTVELIVKETEPGIRGNTSGSSLKAALMNTGFIAQVPFFVNTDDKLLINTDDGSYVSRA